jgi:superfamily I DNA/RNA helicase
MGIRLRDVRYSAGRSMLPQRIAHALLVQMEALGESPDDRVQDAVARSRPVRACVDVLWPAVDPVRLVWRLFTDRAWLAVHAEGLLDDHEQEALLWPRPPRAPGSARWSIADAVLVDEVTDLLDRTASVGHVVLDEAQDLSPMQLRAVGRRCTTGSATLLGDLAQGTTPWATRSWQDALRHLGKPEAEIDELTAGFRVPAEVIDFAARLLPSIAPGLTPPTSVRRAPGGLSIIAAADVEEEVRAAAQHALALPGSVGVIVADARAARIEASLLAAGLPVTVLGSPDDADARLDLVPASLAKGLEFDHVVLVEPADIVAAEPDETTGLRRLYVCLTRAVTSLQIVHHEVLPAALAA